VALKGRKDTVRVLEINAGSGKLTEALGEVILDVLEGTGLQIEYYCTNSDLEVAQKAAEKSRWQPLIPVALDFGKNIKAQLEGISPVDIVVGHNALHVLPELAKALRILNCMTAPGGYIMFIEIDRRASKTALPGVVWCM
jgi:SAM-dependent methyltransferase